MAKKLLQSHLLIFVLLVTGSFQVFAQEDSCPTDVTITGQPDQAICEGTEVTLNADVTGTDTGLTYVWRIDDVVKGTNSNQLITSEISGNPVITVKVTSGECELTDQITITTNENRNGSVKIQADNSEICPGDTVNFTIASSTETGNNPQYDWRVNSTSAGSGQTFSAALSTGDDVQLFVTSSLPCTDDFNSKIITISEKPGIPQQPLAISGNEVSCPGVPESYSISAVNNATSYTWELPSGWSGSSNTTDIQVTTGTAGGTIHVTAENECGYSEKQALHVTIEPAAPGQPGPVSGNSVVCPGTQETYQVNAVPDAEEYVWSFPSDWGTGNPVTTTIPEVSLTTGATGSGSITVLARNSCGEGQVRSMEVTVEPGTPETPGTISGKTEVCPGTQETYQITAVPDAEEYVWTFPSDWGNASPVTTTIPEVTLTTGATGNASISVFARNSCGESSEQSIQVTIKPGTPDTAGEISLDYSNPNSVICPGDQLVFSVTGTAETEEYSWNVPAGWTISGADTASSITAIAGAYGQNGNITVNPANSCGTGPESTLPVSIDPPAPEISGVITGPEAVCATETGLTYSIPDIEHATEYNWDFPSGWNITAGETSSTVTVNASSTGGTISAYALNNCGESAALTLEVDVTTGVPPAPGTISTNLTVNAICPPASEITFSVTDDPEVDSYQWTLPPGWEIASGEGTSAIAVNVTNNAPYNNESVSVEALNICGNSTASTYSDITVSDFVIADLGEDQTVCSTTDPITINAVIGFDNKKLSVESITTTGSGIIEVPNGNNFDNFPITYTPSTADLTAGEVTLTLTTEAPAGACGAGVDEMTILFRPDPTAEIFGSTDICTGSSADIEFSGAPNTTVTYRVNGGTDQAIDLDANGAALVNSGTINETALYELVSISYSQDPGCSQPLTGEASITVNEVPNAEISYGDPAFCEDDTITRDITFTNTAGAYEDGTFSASPSGLIINDITGQIDPGASEPGDYRITYTIPATLGCQVVELGTDVSITAVPTVTISYTNSPFCSSDSSLKQVSLEGTGIYQGGTFSAEGLEINPATGAIDPSASTIGTHTVTYTTPAGEGCGSYEFTTEVIITKAPTPKISYAVTELCTSGSRSQDVVLSGNGQVEGGSYSSSPGLSIDPASGLVDPSTSEPGIYTILYTLPGMDGCGETTAETEINITGLPSAEINYAGPFCASDSVEQTVSFTNTQGNYEGGSFSASPAGLAIDVNTGAIIPSGSTAGDYTIEYLMPAAGGCEAVMATTIVSITEVPSAAIGYNTAPFCTSDETTHTVSFTDTPEEYQNGSFSGSTGLEIDANGTIDASFSTPGTHTVTYSIPAADSCGEVLVTTEVVIYERPQITSQPFNLAVCSTEPTELSVVATGDDLSYQWYKIEAGETVGQVVSGATSAELFNSNTTSADAGQYYVEVSGPGSCSPVTSDTVSLNVDEDIIIHEPATDESVCGNGFSEVTFRFVAHANGAPLDFTWLKDGTPVDAASDENIQIITSDADENGLYEGTLTITGISNEDAATYNGNYNVEINGPEEFTCPTAISNTFLLRVNIMPDPPQVEEIVYCQYDEASPLTVLEGSNLTWYPTGSATDPLEGTPVPDTNTPGTTSYWVTQTPDICESERAEVIVTVKEKPGAPQTTQLVEYCKGATPEALAATGDPNATLNWYNTADATEPLASAPLPVTESSSTTSYWVSQTLDGCESDRVQIDVIINELPVVTVTAAEETICLDTRVDLTAEGASTYLWEDENGEIGEGAILTVSPAITTTYTVTGTDEKGCSNSTEITIEVDQPSVAGTLSAPASVCVSNPNGTLELNGHNGEITGWEYKPASATQWLVLNENNQDSIQGFSDLSEPTSFRVAVKNGVCESAFAEATVEVDPEPVGGKLAFDMTGSDGRFFMICENPEPGYAVDLSLSGNAGDILFWKYRGMTTGWSTLQVGGEPFTGSTLSAQQIENLGINQTTIFRVEIGSGACTPNAFSETAILSVIPSDIEPEPVEVDPDVVCFGEEVTLSAENGYTDRPDILDQGAFDNASITNHGWRIRRNNSSQDLGFDTDANNTEFDRWKRATPREFTTADITSPYSTSGVWFDTGIEDGNKGFGLVSGNNTSTMETPVFAMGAMDQAILTFDQAYSLTPAASIMVEISTDGGATYENVLYRREGPTQSGNYRSFGTGTADNTPNNKIRIDLGNYMGGNNLRIRFNYTGARSGDIWAVDNIDIPDGPKDVTIEWHDYSDPENPVFIGNSNTEQWTPTKIGLNTFEIKTLLIYNSNGDACADAEHTETIDVYVFDNYTSTAAAEVLACGVGTVQLTGSIEGAEQGIIEEFPEGDESVAVWEVVEGPEGYVFSETHFSNNDPEILAINDPGASFTPDVAGSYTIRWAITQDVESLCDTTYVDTSFELMGCTVLDFDGVDDFVDLGTGYSGTYSLEAWVRPEAGDGTIISKRDQHNSGAGYELSLTNGKPVFRWNGGVLTSPEPLAVNDRWYHLAVSFDGTQADLYVDGIRVVERITGSAANLSEAPLIIGANYDISNDSITDHFSGWIEEVRIWNGSISQEQIQFLMNQRLQEAANIGVEIPMPAPGLSYSDLAGYYRLIATDILPGGYTEDLGINAINGQLRNMETLQENTAPLPYTTSGNGKWIDQEATWTHADVWDIPNADGINGVPIEWNIVKTSHDITSQDKDITVLGLISETGELTMADPTDSQDETNIGQMLRVTHYVKLDGSIDLVGESQLLQDTGSIVDAGSTGFLERDQQGTASSYNYNYWSSPVSPGTGNVPYTVAGVMKDGTTTEPRELDFGNPYAYADGGPANPRKVSNYWLHKFHGTSHHYSEWVHIGSTGTLNVGEGYSMKGTSGEAAITDPQNYTFKGIPNNGDITLIIDKGQDYLVGNPYPSAIDAREFILDNMRDVSSAYGAGRNSQNIFSGALYFWSHFSGKTHYLKEYIGGYAVYNLSGGTIAVANDERINATNDSGGEIPGDFIPVGQAFFLTTFLDENLNPTIHGGSIQFQNNQRVYKTENNDESVFHEPESGEKQAKQATDDRLKIWLKFHSPTGILRQLLATADPSTTNDFDLGYDALLIEDHAEDMYWYFSEREFVIQGVGHFNEDQELALGVRIQNEEPFIIAIDQLKNIPDEMNIYLKDSLHELVHDLREEPYESTAEPGEITDRFSIVFTKEAVIADDEDEVEITTGDLDILYVNGTREVLVQNPGLVKISRIYINNLLGQQLHVYENVPLQEENRLPVRMFSSGVYIIKAHTEDGILTKKIILE